MFSDVYISTANCVTPLGNSLLANWNALLADRTGIRKQCFGVFEDIYISKITEEIAVDKSCTYLENMLLKAVIPVVEQNTITSRTGFILSSTKGNIEYLAEGKVAEAELGNLARVLANKLGILTQPIVVSHACVSGLLAVIMAKRLIQIGQFDTVIVVAGDQVSDFVLSGFNAFQAMSDEPCRPFDRDRKGVTLGEASAALWVSKEKEGALVKIIGEGSVNDANHISGPSRTGEGLYKSINAALRESGIDASTIDFVSAHGTATLYNDEMEAIAFNRANLSGIPLHSLKGYYGHTLGASGLLELIVSIQSLQSNTLIPSKGFEENGTSQDINIIQAVQVEVPISVVLKTASGFGGSNAAILIEKV